MKKIIATALLVMGAVMAMPSISATYKIADTFDGCERGKFYPLTKSGKYLRCDQYTYFYKYRPDVILRATESMRSMAEKFVGR